MAARGSTDHAHQVGVKPPTLRVSTALAWSFGNTLAARLGTLLIGVALARLLGPEAFGTYAVALVALLAVLSFNELGVSLAIVRWPENPRQIAPTVTTISLIMSGLVTCAAYWAAPYFAAAMGDPRATLPIRLLCVCILMNGIVATPAALLQRHFRQDKRALSDQVNVWLGAVVSLGLALFGLGAVGLAIGRLAGSAVSGILLIAASPEPYRIGFDRKLVRPLLRFGAPLAGTSLVAFLATYADQLLVGRLLGPVALGLFVLAFNLSSWPVAMISQPLRNVAPALLARLQSDPAQMSTTWSRLLSPVACVALPTCFALAATAEGLVTTVYGQEWSGAAAALRWLALLAAARIMLELVYDYVVVLGWSGSLLSVQLVWIGALVPFIWFGATFAGIVGVAAAELGVALLVVLPMNLQLTRRAGVRARTVARRVLPALSSSSLLMFGLLALTSTSWPIPLQLLTTAICTVMTSGSLLYLARSDLLVFREAPAGVDLNETPDPPRSAAKHRLFDLANGDSKLFRIRL